MTKQNNSMGYQLPYKTLDIMDIRDIRIYTLICIYEIMVIPSIVFGYVGFDCMFINLTIQVIAQFAILSYKVKAALNNSENYHDGMKKLILRHYRLIRLTEGLEDNFNFLIMQQLISTTTLLSFSEKQNGHGSSFQEDSDFKIFEVSLMKKLSQSLDTR
ncbi:odorant receptor 4-like [Vespula maculifrons]|uniref:Odorant receptor 4-like n=1 Tax=Vespula maculifrons TaxID=7453 RepID=A0ABD2BPH3_VESMC